MFEAKKCVENGADEIDMVINVSLLKSGCYMKVADEIRLVKEAIGDKKLKVILETCYLNSEEIIVASQMVVSGRADFVKTSTGFSESGATLTWRREIGRRTFDERSRWEFSRNQSLWRNQRLRYCCELYRSRSYKIGNFFRNCHSDTKATYG